MKKTKKKLFDPSSLQPFKISRAKIELFKECPCCFYMDRKHGISRPSGPSFTLNNAVDALWKSEFDFHRAQGTPHPIAVQFGIDAIPLQHEQIDDWRNNKRGLSFLHEPTLFQVTGALDEIWVTPQEELLVVDVKATSKNTEINLDAAWQISYKRQMDIYQWLLRQNGFKVSHRGYFVYCNGKKDEASSGVSLAFDVTVIPYDGNDTWIESTLHEIRACLVSETIPDSAPNCKHCSYYNSLRQIFEKIDG